MNRSTGAWAAALAVVLLVFACLIGQGRQPPVAAPATPIAAKRHPRHLPPPLPVTAEVAAPTVDPTSPASGAWDFNGHEHHGPSEHTLSPDIATADLRAIDAAWSSGDFAQAARLAAAFAWEADRRQVLVPLLDEWAEAQPEAAARFALSLPAAAERGEMLETVAQAWAARDLAAASAWIDGLEVRPEHDGAVAAIATHTALVTHRPEIAMSWAESLAGARHRRDVIGAVALTWAHADPEAVGNYLETSAVLTPAERRDLLTFVRNQTALVP